MQLCSLDGVAGHWCLNYFTVSFYFFWVISLVSW